MYSLQSHYHLRQSPDEDLGPANLVLRLRVWVVAVADEQMISQLRARDGINLLVSLAF